MAFHHLLWIFAIFSGITDGWRLPTEKTEGTVLFQENFDMGTPFPDGWLQYNGLGDRFDGNVWRLPDPDLRQPPGVLAALTQTAAGGCVPANRFLFTPPIQTGETDRVEIRFRSFFKPLASDPPTPPPTMQVYLLTPEDANAIRAGQRPQFDPMPISAEADTWVDFNSPLVPLGLNQEFVIGFRIQSDLMSCGLLLIDDLVILGENQAQTESCDLGPNTLLELVKPADAPPDRVLISQNEEVALKASVCSETEGFTFVWTTFHPDSGTTEILNETGPNLTTSFARLGPYQLFVAAMDASGYQDPTPAQYVFDVVANHNLESEITVPMQPVVKTSAGQTIAFAAQIKGEPIEGVTFLWKRMSLTAERDLKCYEGAEVQIEFPATGLYQVTCQAVDPSGHEERFPQTREVLVSQEGVHVAIVSPERTDRELLVNLNQTVEFIGELDDPRGQVKTGFWFIEGREERLCENQNTCQITFDSAGPAAVGLVALGSDGQPLDGDFMRILVEPPLFLSILSPSRREEIPINQEFVLSGELKGSLVETLPDPDDVSLSWTFNGVTYQGGTVTVPGVPTAGRRQAVFVARHLDSGQFIDKRIDVHIYNPDDIPPPEILHPRTDVHMPEGQSVFFDSSFRGALSTAQSVWWEVTNVDTSSTLITGAGATLGKVTFEEAGFYEANLYQSGSRGDVLVDSRDIQVGTVGNEIFTDNDDIDRAASLNAGRYEGFNLDKAQYYEITIPKDEQVARITVEADGEADLVVVGPDDKTLISRRIFGSHAFQAPHLKAGALRLGLLPVPGGKKNLTFSFGIDVLNPGLYFSDITEDGSFATSIGMINTTSSTAELELIAYDAAGNILEKTPQTLAAQGSYRDEVSSIFPDSYASIAWIRVDSTHELAGFSRTLSRDDMEAYGVDAGKYLYSELYVPHIATDTATWSTKANLINGNADSADPQMEAGAQSGTLTNSAGYAKDGFDFKTKLGGAIATDTRWGRFFESGSTLALSGNEVFSKVDGTRQSAGLGLAVAPSENPNLNTDSNTLYFAHIARNTASFWTALALVNISGAEQGARITAYGPGGSLVGEKTVNLPVDGKVVQLAETFLDGVGTPADVDWLQVTADAGIVGYELFGTHDTRQMAGLEAITDVKTELCFPFIDPTGESWHGIALVNVTQSAATATFTLHSTSGDTATTPVTRTLAAKEKQSLLLTDLFPEVPLTAAWLSVTSDKELVGFQLFGSYTFEHMSGLVAQ